MPKAFLTDINGDKLNVVDCYLVTGWVNFKLNGKSYSTPSDKVLMIEWKNAKT